MKVFDITDALLSLVPNARWSYRGQGYDGLEWLENYPPPTKEEIEAEITRLQSEYDSVKYKLERKQEYPPIGDQLDALWKGGDAAAEMLAMVQAVKAKYPKPAQ
jgi:hypothetical protein